MIDWLVTFTAVFLTLMAVGMGASQPEDQSAPPPPAPVKQPVVFSHSRHANVGVECSVCHPVSEPGDFAGIPRKEDCLNCHQDADPESQAFRSLFEHEKSGRDKHGRESIRSPISSFFSAISCIWTLRRNARPAMVRWRVERYCGRKRKSQ